jgi:beta-1,4-mannosyl-glycoprotein beta-1,4-N-acetylglucosaminyltransferase|tara:strand:+ start:480 stop:1367 length:888 start_codon:yes stop_codon:yes gene_type:complete
MNIVDCFMYFDEDMILDIRLNILDKYVSHFLICEANFNHNGTKRDLRFNINNFSKFRKKITYIPLDKQPNNLRIINEEDTTLVKNSKILDNALLRENFQRNFLQNKIKDFNEDDLIIISDLDEIPNLQNFKYKNKITFFEQKMFYYKLNLIHQNFLWYGSKICKKRHLISPQWLRNIKSKKYSFWRLDTYFSKTKYNDISFKKDGGWHFTNIKSPENIDFKMKNFLHHLEYEESGLGVEDVKKIMEEKKVFYDHSADKKQKKWNTGASLIKENDNSLPDYITLNKEKFKNWLDLS